MFNVGGGELLVILLLALIVLGPDKLPNAARQAGKYLTEFRRMSQGFQQELRNAMDLDGTHPARPPDPGPTLPPIEPPSPPVVDAVTASAVAGSVVDDPLDRRATDPAENPRTGSNDGRDDARVAPAGDASTDRVAGGTVPADDGRASGGLAEDGLGDGSGGGAPASGDRTTPPPGGESGGRGHRLRVDGPTSSFS
jgi:Tat protein translocase TatB subunit